MEVTQKDIKAFQKKILEWYAQHKRNLPWRNVPSDASLQERAYQVFISEVMSQQTQINRVVAKYEAWIKKFPTVIHLGQASVADILQYWSGLGYNRRALNLKKAAEIIVANFDGKFPATEKELLTLPGIGKYTARAILCFAFDQQIAVVDTNIRKVILTQFISRHRGERNDKAISNEIASPLRGLAMTVTDKEIEDIAETLLPVGRAYDWNQALMDYAAAELKKEKIPLPKQSKFIGSHRYYRGQILKYLLKNKKVSLVDLGPAIKKEYIHAEKAWFEKLVQELIDEGFIIKRNDLITLVE